MRAGCRDGLAWVKQKKSSVPVSRPPLTLQVKDAVRVQRLSDARCVDRPHGRAAFRNGCAWEVGLEGRALFS